MADKFKEASIVYVVFNGIFFGGNLLTVMSNLDTRYGIGFSEIGIMLIPLIWIIGGAFAIYRRYRTIVRGLALLYGFLAVRYSFEGILNFLANPQPLGLWFLATIYIVAFMLARAAWNWEIRKERTPAG